MEDMKSNKLEMRSDENHQWDLRTHSNIDVMRSNHIDHIWKRNIMDKAYEHLGEQKLMEFFNHVGIYW